MKISGNRNNDIEVYFPLTVEALIWHEIGQSGACFQSGTTPIGLLSTFRGKTPLSHVIRMTYKTTTQPASLRISILTAELWPQSGSLFVVYL